MPLSQLDESIEGKSPNQIYSLVRKALTEFYDKNTADDIYYDVGNYMMRYDTGMEDKKPSEAVLDMFKAQTRTR